METIRPEVGQKIGFFANYLGYRAYFKGSVTKVIKADKELDTLFLIANATCSVRNTFFYGPAFFVLIEMKHIQVLTDD